MEDEVTPALTPDPQPSAPTPSETPEPAQDPFEAAFTRAQARVSEPEPDEEDGDPATTDASRRSLPSDANPPEPDSNLTPSTEPDAAHEAAAAARERERLRAELRAQIAAETAEEQEFRKLYTGLLAEEAEDPEAFAQRLRTDPRGPEQLRFMQAYAKAHPEVGLDDPETPVVRRAEVYNEALGDAFTIVDDAIEAVAGKYGLPPSTLEAAYQKSGSNFPAYLEAIVQAAVAAGVERERPKIVEAERKAAAAEMQVVRAKSNIVTPRALAGSSAPAAKQKIDHYDTAAALATASRRAAARIGA